MDWVQSFCYSPPPPSHTLSLQKLTKTFVIVCRSFNHSNSPLSWPPRDLSNPATSTRIDPLATRSKGLRIKDRLQSPVSAIRLASTPLFSSYLILGNSSFLTCCCSRHFLLLKSSLTCYDDQRHEPVRSGPNINTLARTVNSHSHTGCIERD